MPNWKKLIVSGSDANLNSLDIATELTASDALITNDLDVLGNVGIGTTSPSYKLHVNVGTDNQSALFESTDTSNSISLSDSGTTLPTSVGVGVVGNDMFLYAGPTANQQRIRIQGSTGNVGIGTTSPSGKLTVDNTNTIMLDLKRSGNLKARFIADSNKGQLDIFDTSASKVRLHAGGDSYLNGGNVGIGTDNPTQKLDVNGAITNSNGTVRIQSVGSQNVEIASTRDIRLFIDSNDDDTNNRFEIQSNTSAPNDSNIVFVVEQDGKTGVGTTSPTEKLQVTGNVSASGDFIGTNFTGSSFTGSFVGDGSGLTGLNSGSWDGIFTGSAQITGSLEVIGNITASNNISASGNITAVTASLQHIEFPDNSNIVSLPAGHKLEFGESELKLTSGDDITLQIDDGFTFSDTFLTIPGTISNVSTIHVTASGNISASGDLYGNEIFADSKYYTNGLPTIFNNGVKTFFGIFTQPTEIQGTNIKLDAPVTASGNISASGDFIGTNFTGSSFTGSFVGDGSGLTDTPININAGTALTFSGNTLNVSTAGANLGSLNIPTSTADRNYGIQHQNTAAQTLVVNVPWTDTTYTAGTGLSLSAGNVFSANTSGVPVIVGSSIPATVSNRYYAIQTNIGDELIVNVPWTDTSWDGIFSGSAQITGSLGVTGSVLVDGNVGIGTTNPAQKLHISDSNARIRIQDSDGTNQYFELRQSGGDSIFTSRDNTNNGEFQFKLFDGTTSTTALRIFSNLNSTFAGSITATTMTLSSTTDQILNLDSTDNGAVYTALKRSNSRIGYVGFGGSGSTLTFANELSGTVSISNPAGSLAINPNGSATFTGNVAAPTFLGDLSGSINTLTTAVTKPDATNDTTVATTAFVQSLIGTIPAGLVFQGTWNAATNTPTLASGTGTTGHFYIVSVDGSTNLDGITDWKVGDWAVFVEQGATDAWEKVDNSSVLDGSGTGNQITKWAGSGTSNTLTNSIITDNGTNVGIGTASPSQKLEVAGNVKLDGDNRHIFFGGNNTFIGERSNSTELELRGGGNTTAKTVFINTDGNLGIGTSVPAQKIHIKAADARVRIEDSDGTNQFLEMRQNGATASFRSRNDNSNGSFNFDAYDGTTVSTFMTIDDSGKVGIGTTSPSANLQIVGTSGYVLKTSGDISLTTYTGDTKIDMANNVLQLLSPSGNVQIGDTESDGNGTSIKVDDANSIIDISGNISSSGDFIGRNFTGSSFTGSFVGDGSGLTGVLVNSGSWDGIFSGSAQITGSLGVTGSVLVDGNVGIGTTSPSTKLEVVGNILANATNATVNIGSTISSALTYGYPNTAAGTLIVGGYTNGGSSYQPGVVSFINQNPSIGAGTDLGVLQFAGKDDASSPYVSSNIKAFTAAAAGSGNSGGGIITISTSAGGAGAFPTERFRINQTGNIGIGTTNPSTKLHVSSATSTSITTVGVQTQSGVIGNLAGIGFATSGTAGKYKSAIGHITTGNSQGIGAMVFCVDGVVDANPVGIGDEKMRIDSSGNVGIGTTSPSDELTIAAETPTIRLDDISSSNYAELYVNNFDTYLDSNGRLFIQNAASTKVTIATTGNVGIGTTSPSYKLDIESGATSDIARFKNNNGSIVLGYASTQASIDLPATNTFRIRQGSETPLRIISNGNVGIGTTSPTEKLQVTGNVSASGDFIGTNFTGSSFTGSFVGDGSGLTNLPISDPFPFTGSAQITGSLGVTGSVEVEGYIKASGSIQVGVNEGNPTAALVGSIRYKSDANNSFVDMVMQTDVTTYEWVNIVTNTW